MIDQQGSVRWHHRQSLLQPPRSSTLSFWKNHLIKVAALTNYMASVCLPGATKRPCPMVWCICNHISVTCLLRQLRWRGASCYYTRLLHLGCFNLAFVDERDRQRVAKAELASTTSAKKDRKRRGEERKRKRKRAYNEEQEGPSYVAGAF